MGEKRLRHMLLDAAKSIARRILDSPPPAFEPGTRCRVRHSVVPDKTGTLIRGSLVEVTGVQDRLGRFQIRVLDLPDFEWDATRRLPYGPGFVLYVSANVLEVIK
jgi:hypothetical protein